MLAAGQSVIPSSHGSSKHTSAINLFHPLLPAHRLNIAVPKLGPHNQPPAATAKVLMPSTTMGSSPEICAPHESKSCCARTGVTIPTAATDVTTEQPTLIHLLFLRRSKKRSQVRTSGGGSCRDAVEVEACLAPAFAVCAFTNWEVMVGRRTSVVRWGCFDGLAVLNATVVLAEKENAAGLALGSLKQVVLGQSTVAMVGGCGVG